MSSVANTDLTDLVSFDELFESDGIVDVCQRRVAAVDKFRPLLEPVMSGVDIP